MATGNKPISKAQQKAVHKYVKNNYDRVELVIKKGTKQAILDIAGPRSESINGFIKRAIKAQIKAETGQDIDL